MTDQGENLLSATQLATLESTFRRGSASASEALAKWIGKPSVVDFDSLEQLPMEEATELLTRGDDAPICSCSMQIQGIITGEMILAFDDASGWALADILLDNPQGTTTEWTELTTSAALETTNILCCAYLNALQQSLSVGSESQEVVPTPPRFSREFAESLMEFVLMGQAIAFDQAILARTRFEIDRLAVNWTLLFVPDAESMSRLPELLLSGESER
ncbi:hypothetical protein FF011L_33750 [Roseimaritima multifibrata]|uniref:CheY-P phosphatase CheC n=1 Tax=Roseimaritima multifibrata TaxID=1930274 RepID=A0A517MI86_9BACT|nr:chemotaxis protein CheC [Roseimaritima multifibrata]QDS94596.1 hypothetical protein FF011L_33750 [Roseimaritima multifibrata]